MYSIEESIKKYEEKELFVFPEATSNFVYVDLSKIKRRKKYFYIVENNEKKDKITKVEIDDAKKGIGR